MIYEDFFYERSHSWERAVGWWIKSGGKKKKAEEMFSIKHISCMYTVCAYQDKLQRDITEYESFLLIFFKKRKRRENAIKEKQKQIVTKKRRGKIRKVTEKRKNRRKRS